MERQEQVRSRTRRFIQVTAKETLRRLVEIFLQCLALSLVKIFIEGMGLDGNADYYPITQILCFLAFQVCTVWFCRKSSRRVRYYGRYYASNLLAYILFFLLSNAVMYFFGLSIYMLPFRVTVTLVVKQVVSVSYMLFMILAFHGLTVLVILLSPRGGVVGIYYRLKSLFGK